MEKREKAFLICIIILLISGLAFAEYYKYKMREMENTYADGISAGTSDAANTDPQGFSEELAQHYREEAMRNLDLNERRFSRIAKMQAREVNYNIAFSSDGKEIAVFDREIDFSGMDAGENAVRTLGRDNYSAATMFQKLPEVANCNMLGVLDLLQWQVDKISGFYGLVGREDGSSLSLERFYARAIQGHYTEGSYYAMLVDRELNWTELGGNQAIMAFVLELIDSGTLGEAVAGSIDGDSPQDYGDEDAAEDFRAGSVGEYFAVRDYILNHETGSITIEGSGCCEDTVTYDSLGDLFAELLSGSAGYAANFMWSDTQLCVARIHEGHVYLEVYGKAALEGWMWVEEWDSEQEDYVDGEEYVVIFDGIYALPRN